MKQTLVALCAKPKLSVDSHKGASIYDVRTEGGEGVSPKEDIVREVA